MNGRKINSDLENPIDNIFIKICYLITPIIYKLKITPNMITIFRLLFILYQIIQLKLKKISIEQFIIYYIFYYFLDCLDGYLARQYNMITKLGDYLDHITDNLVFIIIFILFLYPRLELKGYLVLFIFLILLSYHLGCQELYYNIDSNDILSNFKQFCRSKDDIYFSKYFGCGTYNLVFLMILYYNNI